MELLVCFGVVYGVTESSLLAPLRIAIALRSQFFEMGIYCPYCVGFWVGGFVSLLANALAASNPTFFGFAAIAVPDFIAHAFLVVGAIAVFKASLPDFLLSAYGRGEGAYIDEVREHELAHAHADDAADDVVKETIDE